MESEQSLKQRKIALAQSEHASIVAHIIRDCIPQTPLVTSSEWETIVNAITFDAYSSMVLNVVDYLDRIRKGELHDIK